MLKLLIFGALFVAAVVARQTAQLFAADVRIYDDPNIRGVLTGRMFYDYANAQQRVNYNVGPREIILYDRKLRYLYCSGTCDAETLNEPQPKFFREQGDATHTTVSVGGRSCTGYQKSNVPSSGVRYIWVDGNGVACRAEFADGKKIDFTNIGAVTPLDVFDEWRTWNCPSQQCNRMIDFMLVFDESGSIDSTSFRQMKDFGSNIARAYTFSPYHVAMGLVFFSDDSRLIIGLTVVQQSFLNAMGGATQRGGFTCIGCGIERGHNQFRSNGRPGVTKVCIVLTDGRNNRVTERFNAVVTAAKNDGILFFAIGVAQAVQSEIDYIASDIPGVQTSFFTADFSQLSGILDALVVATCIDIPGNPCGAGCLGFCGCGATCICPDTCDDGNQCTTDSCVAGQNGNGCSYVTASCSDNNACTDDSCVPATGCVHTNRTCDQGNLCLIYRCVPSVGCQTVNRDCNDGNPCTGDNCNPNTGCENPAASCPLCTDPNTGLPKTCTPVPCQNVQCDNTDGQCKGTPIDCNDNNLCSVDSCNPLIGSGVCEYTPVSCDDVNACTHDYCDPQTGCQHIPFNITLDCNDNNVCTNDSCDSVLGCIHPIITCNDANLCSDDTCNSLLGCQFPLKDCGQDPRIKQLIGDCYIALCSNERSGCYLEQIAGTSVDECQVCNGDGSSCTFGLSTEEVVGISAGLLAVIIIASIIVCAAIGIFGGKKGYDIWLNHRNNMQGANTNPLYKDDGMTGTNPLYAS